MHKISWIVGQNLYTTDLELNWTLLAFINTCREGGVILSPVTITGSPGGSGSGGSTTSSAMRPGALGRAVLAAIAFVVIFA